MRWIIYGAGAIGGTIGARLHMAGESVVLIARGEHANVMANSGMTFIHPGSAESGNTENASESVERLQLDVVEHPSHLQPGAGDVVLLCMKTQHTAGALADLVTSGFYEQPVFCVQNGVANERMVARRLPNVFGTVVNLPASHLEPGVIATYAGAGGQAGGVLDSGSYPGDPVAVDAQAEAVCAGLRRAGFAATATPDVMAQKYAKLLTNLSNALELILANRDDFRAAGRALRSEAIACFAAAGISYVPIREYVARNSSIYEPVNLPSAPRGGGSTWQSLQRGAAEIETDYLNGEIVLLGKLHGLSTPANARVQTLAQQVISGRRNAQSLTWAEIDADKFQ